MVVFLLSLSKSGGNGDVSLGGNPSYLAVLRVDFRMEVLTLSDTYQDSVKLMRVANETRENFDVEEAVAMMGTQENREMLREMGSIDEATLTELQPDDLILAVADEDQNRARDALDWMEAEVRGTQERDDTEDTDERPAKSIYGALDRHPTANIELISVPSEYAAREAWKALHEDLHVHIFSDNVTLDHEQKLKAYGRDHDQLVMGPDCGTAIINGVPLGFANDVDDGTIGVVAAAGSGLQEVTSLIDRAGAGISQAIGTGGRDLSDEIGGTTMRQGLELLADDAATDVIVLISKPPDPRTQETLLEDVSDCSKPVVVEFVGSDPDPVTAAGGIPADSLADAARQAVTALPEHTGSVSFGDDLDAFATPAAAPEIIRDRANPGPERSAIRGLYSGGTLAGEAATRLESEIPDLTTNVGIGTTITDPRNPVGNAVVDLGADTFTRGRPHPMIDSSIRDDQLTAALQSDDVLVVLMDVILGYAAHDDPATPVVEILEDERSGDWPLVVASVVGTRGDPQDWEAQVSKLAEGGVIVCESNAGAVDLTAAIHGTISADGGVPK